MGTIRSHMFSHKNEEERAIARATNDGNVRELALRESEMTAPKYFCKYENCSYASKNVKNLKRHHNSHLSRDERPDMALCPECGKRMLKESLALHIEKSHRPELVEKALFCGICNKKYHPQDRRLLEKHMRNHRGEKPFLCPECGLGFVGLAEMNMHIKIVHRPQDPVKCKWCDKVFNKSKSWKCHAERNHPLEFLPTRPPACKRMSKFYYNEEQANQGFIGPIQQYPCPICETVCKVKCSLKKHMERFHSGDGRERQRQRKKTSAGGMGVVEAPSTEAFSFPQNSMAHSSATTTAMFFAMGSNSSTAEVKYKYNEPNI